MNEMVMSCVLLEYTLYCLVFFCNYLQMAVSMDRIIAQIQHLPIIFHHLSYLTAIPHKQRKHFSTLSFVVQTAQSLLHFSSFVEDFVWCDKIKLLFKFFSASHVTGKICPSQNSCFRTDNKNIDNSWSSTRRPTGDFHSIREFIQFNDMLKAETEMQSRNKSLIS